MRTLATRHKLLTLCASLSEEGATGLLSMLKCNRCGCQGTVLQQGTQQGWHVLLIIFLSYPSSEELRAAWTFPLPILSSAQSWGANRDSIWAYEAFYGLALKQKSFFFGSSNQAGQLYQTALSLWPPAEQVHLFAKKTTCQLTCLTQHLCVPYCISAPTVNSQMVSYSG